jgi:hypothetical protein
MNQFITLPLFIFYCEKVTNDLRFIAAFENRLENINHNLRVLKKEHEFLIPPKMLDLIQKYDYIDSILYQIFILRDDTVSYEELYNELINFMLFMDEAYASADPNLYKA